MSIYSRPAGFRFTDEEYGMMDQLQRRFWLLFTSRKQILSMALRAVWDAVFMGGTLLGQIEQLQCVLCAHRESAQLSFAFPPPARQGMRLRVHFSHHLPALKEAR